MSRLRDDERDIVLRFEADVTSAGVTLRNDTHTLEFVSPSEFDAPDWRGEHVGVRWDGELFSPAIATFIAWHSLGRGRVVFLTKIREAVGAPRLDFVVEKSAKEVLEAIVAMIQATGELPTLDAAGRATYATDGSAPTDEASDDRSS